MFDAPMSNHKVKKDTWYLWRGSHHDEFDVPLKDRAARMQRAQTRRGHEQHLCCTLSAVWFFKAENLATDCAFKRDPTHRL